MDNLSPDKNHFTYQSRLVVTPQQDDCLSSCAKHLSKVEHTLLADFNKGLNIRNQKSDCLQKFKIMARHFNSVRISLEGKISSIKASRDNQIDDLKIKLKNVKRVVSRLQKLTARSDKQASDLHQKKRRVGRLSLKLERLEQDKADNKVRLCFGNKKLFKKQYNLEENGYASHEEWREDWQKARSDEFTLIGSKDETAGNQLCVVSLNEDKTLNLRVRVPPVFEEKFGKHILFEHIELHYGKENILSAIESNNKRKTLSKKAFRQEFEDLYKEHGQAINYKFKQDEKGWRVYITVNVTPPEIKTVENIGAIGVDINVNHLAVAETDRTGNPVHSFDVSMNTYGKSKDQAKAIIGDGVKALVLFALKQEKPLVIEKLDFTKKKRSLSSMNSRRARQLSSFCYSTIIEGVKACAFRAGVKVHEVNPAYSSIIGRVKFARWSYNYLSNHRAAALVIARRYLGFSERLPRCLDGIPDNKGGHVTLSGLVKISSRHLWLTWADVQKKLKEVPAAQRQKFRQAVDPPALTRDCEEDTLPF